MKHMTLEDFLRFLSDADGGDALELISKFQSGSVSVDGFTVSDFED